MSYPTRTEIEILSVDPDPPKMRKLHSYIIINSSGKCQIRQPQTRKLKLGWTVREEIGIVYFNPRAVSKIIKTKNE